MASPRDHDRRASTERGGALIFALFLMIVMGGLVVTGSLMLTSSRNRTETSFLISGQSAALARSGLIEAINWFRRQPSQPVLSFAPVLNTAVTPPVLDTEDPDIGLVREVRIHGRLWGRYEVWKEWAADPIPERASWRSKIHSEDISLKRRRATPGGPRPAVRPLRRRRRRP